jgi:hypothetical protein
MCLIIHKPAGVNIPRRLLHSAAEHNRDGFGAMAFDGNGRLRVTRRHITLPWEFLSVYEDYARGECVLHLRRSTRGLATDPENTHPFEIAEHLYLAHNGTLAVDCRVPGRSDTWHLVHDHLRPVVARNPDVIYDAVFQTLLKGLAGPENKFVFMDASRRQTLILNREHGIELDGLWLSNSRWFDADRFGLVRQGLNAIRTGMNRIRFLN